jgi:hypothetical protein
LNYNVLARHRVFKYLERKALWKKVKGRFEAYEKKMNS